MYTGNAVCKTNCCFTLNTCSRNKAPNHRLLSKPESLVERGCHRLRSAQLTCEVTVNYLFARKVSRSTTFLLPAPQRCMLGHIEAAAGRTVAAAAGWQPSVRAPAPVDPALLSRLQPLPSGTCNGAMGTRGHCLTVRPIVCCCLRVSCWDSDSDEELAAMLATTAVLAGAAGRLACCCISSLRS